MPSISVIVNDSGTGQEPQLSEIPAPVISADTDEAPYRNPLMCGLYFPKADYADLTFEVELGTSGKFYVDVDRAYDPYDQTLYIMLDGVYKDFKNLSSPILAKLPGRTFSMPLYIKAKATTHIPKEKMNLVTNIPPSIVLLAWDSILSFR